MHPELKTQLEFVENQVIIWAIESPRLMRKYLGNLIHQTISREGEFVLSDQGKEVEISKNVDIVLNPFEVDVNDKKCINKIYSELRELAYGEKYYLRSQQLFGMITNFLLELEQESSVNLSFGELDFIQLLKAMGVKCDDSDNGLVGRLGQYLQVISRILNKRVVVFVNLSAYLEQKELILLLEQAFYLKIYVVLIEKDDICLAFPKKTYIIDSDGCEIF